jgi:hypothetical protein
MGFPPSEVGYTSATTGRGNHEVRKGHVVALEREGEKNFHNIFVYLLFIFLVYIYSLLTVGL